MRLTVILPVVLGGQASKIFVTGNRHSYWHHCVLDNRIPMLWTPLGESSSGKQGIMPNFSYPIHSGGGVRPSTIRKLYYCTMIHSPDTTAGSDIIIIGTSPANHNVPVGMAHEVFNNIVVVMDNERYTNGNGDAVAYRLSCKQADAGTHHYDYNCYWRAVPIRWILKEIQDSRNVNRQSFASLDAFRASGKYALSASMY